LRPVRIPFFTLHVPMRAPRGIQSIFEYIFDKFFTYETAMWRYGLHRMPGKDKKWRMH